MAKILSLGEARRICDKHNLRGKTNWEASLLDNGKLVFFLTDDPTNHEFYNNFLTDLHLNGYIYNRDLNNEGRYLANIFEHKGDGHLYLVVVSRIISHVDPRDLN